jgi:hypothetical protein
MESIRETMAEDTTSLRGSVVDEYRQSTAVEGSVKDLAKNMNFGFLGKSP